MDIGEASIMIKINVPHPSTCKLQEYTEHHLRTWSSSTIHWKYKTHAGSFGNMFEKLNHVNANSSPLPDLKFKCKGELELKAFPKGGIVHLCHVDKKSISYSKEGVIVVTPESRKIITKALTKIENAIYAPYSKAHADHEYDMGVLEYGSGLNLDKTFKAISVGLIKYDYNGKNPRLYASYDSVISELYYAVTPLLPLENVPKNIEVSEDGIPYYKDEKVYDFSIDVNVSDNIGDLIEEAKKRYIDTLGAYDYQIIDSTWDDYLARVCDYRRSSSTSIAYGIIKPNWQRPEDSWTTENAQNYIAKYLVNLVSFEPCLHKDVQSDLLELFLQDGQNSSMKLLDFSERRAD